MKPINRRQIKSLEAHHNASWRDPIQIISQWQDASETDPMLLRYEVRGNWWEALASCDVTLLVTREYEHLTMALTVSDGEPLISYWSIPHPSGIVVDRDRSVVYVASTRNPNQIYALRPVTKLIDRHDISLETLSDHPLIPEYSRFLPGSLYIHDLALIKGDLFANAVGQNAIIRLPETGGYQRVWWPHCIETDTGPVFERNHLQLNSIAAGKDLATSYFSASTDRLSARRPGHKNFPVDRRGVLFAGDTREAVARGLTRPHSARFYDDHIWIDNSGYGEVGIIEDKVFKPLAKLPGWTRGLCFCKHIAFVGTSRVIPRFSQYAPGLDIGASICGIHAFDTISHRILGSVMWPAGNQIFAIDWISKEHTSGFPCVVGKKRATARNKNLFYAFSMGEHYDA